MLGEDVIPLDDSDADAPPEQHPADALIVRKALERQVAAPGEEAPSGAAAADASADAAAPAAKKRRIRPDLALNITHSEEREEGAIDLSSGSASPSHSGSDSHSSEQQQRQRRLRQPGGQGQQLLLGQRGRAFKPPVGVTLIADDEETRQLGVVRANRQARYWMGGSFESAKKCFNCGQTGHYSRECPNEGKQRPCVLCARFGHDEWACPAKSQRCYFCNRLGHVSKDCPHTGSGDVIPMLCTRCGRPECGASGQPDWVRAEGGCTRDYLPEDRALVQCLTCGGAGHCICAPATAPAPAPSCHNCGRAGHTGTGCPEALTQAARRERLDAANHRGIEAVRSAPQPHRGGGRQSYWQGEGGAQQQPPARWQGGEYGQSPAYGTPQSDGGAAQPPPPQQPPPGHTAPPAYARVPEGAAGAYAAVYPSRGRVLRPEYAAYSTPEQAAFPRNRRR